MEGGDESMTDLGVVSGDLVYVLSNCGQPVCPAEVEKSNCELCPNPSTTMICSSGSDFAVHSDVAGMETTDIRNIGENCAREVVNNTGDEDQTTTCSRTVMDVSEKQHSTTIEKMDSFADRSHQTVVEAGSTGVPCAMSAEEMQLVNRYLNEPMVIREASDHALPQTLILADSVVRPQTPDAALLTVIDVLMSELGYQRTAVCASKLLRCRTAYTLVVLATFQLSILCHFFRFSELFFESCRFLLPQHSHVLVFAVPVWVVTLKFLQDLLHQKNMDFLDCVTLFL